MEQKHLLIAGIVCIVLCAICLFVAFERYQTNANNVEAMNKLGGSTPFGGMVGKMEPATPAATKYALALAALSGIGGAILTIKGSATSGGETREVS